MLSVHAAEIIAIAGDGAVYHPNCMKEEIAAVAEEQEKRQEHDGGFGYTRPHFWRLWQELYPELVPISRYTIDNWAGDNQYEELSQLTSGPAKYLLERIDDADLLDDLKEEIAYGGFDLDRWLDRWVDELTSSGITCDACGEEIS